MCCYSLICLRSSKDPRRPTRSLASRIPHDGGKSASRHKERRERGGCVQPVPLQEQQVFSAGEDVLRRAQLQAFEQDRSSRGTLLSPSQRLAQLCRESLLYIVETERAEPTSSSNILLPPACWLYRPAWWLLRRLFIEHFRARSVVTQAILP